MVAQPQMISSKLRQWWESSVLPEGSSDAIAPVEADLFGRGKANARAKVAKTAIIRDEADMEGRWMLTTFGLKDSERSLRVLGYCSASFT